MNISELPSDTLLIVKAGDIQALADRIIEKISGPVPPVSSVSDDPLTQKEAIDLLKISRPTFIRWRKAGIIAGHTMGGRVYFFRSELVASLKNDPCSITFATH